MDIMIQPYDSIQYEPYKNRTLDVDKPVEVYRCLNRQGKVFSLRQDGLVVGHTKRILLKECDFVVQASGWERCRSQCKRNVHAFVRGKVTTNFVTVSKPAVKVQYNPYKAGCFHYKDEGIVPVRQAEYVFINNGELIVQPENLK